MVAKEYKYLKFICLSKLTSWDVKSYTQKEMTSCFDIVTLGDYLENQTTKYKLFEEPEKEFGILGVNNKEGIFDAYTEKGGKINQAYKKMKTNWIAYNPYRVNIGSIGIKRESHKYDYISPAYVVFSCLQFGDDKGLLPDYLFMLFKTNTFNKIIRDNTTGSVRQNLKFSSLANIQIPLPPLSEQEKIVQEYNELIQKAQAQETEAKQKENQIEEYLFDKLGIEKPKEAIKKKGLNFVRFKDLVDKWELFKINNNYDNYKSSYNLKPLNELCFNFSNGVNFNKEQMGAGVKFVNIKDIYKNDFLDTRELSRINISEKEVIRKKVSKNDIIFVRSSVKYEGVAYPCLIDKELKEDIVFCGFLIKCTINKNIINPKYLLYLLKSNLIRNISISKSNKTIITNISQENLKTVQIPLPPLEIQKEIVEHITGIKEEIKELRHQAEQNKELAIKNFEQEVFE